MKQELSYILLTPYTIAKSRTGGVLARLLTRLDLELVAAQMIAPSQELAESYAESMMTYVNQEYPVSGQILMNYVLNNLAPSEGRRHRVLLLLFYGENACRKLQDISGALFPDHRGIESINGETIRDTYADLIVDKEYPEKVHYFEPAVLTPPTPDMANSNLKLFADFLIKESNIVENMVYPNPDKIERTLVIIKPDNWRFPSSRPGSIIDMFSRTGLRMIGCKLYQMSVAEAMEFYGPVKDVLIEKLAPIFGSKAKQTLEQVFQIDLNDKNEKDLIASFGVAYARDQFAQIVEFMSGQRPERCPQEEMARPGKVKSMVLIYEGEGAVQKIRDVLGPTDPTKAPGGTVRREFGSDIMVNTAHASDSPGSAIREMKIVGISQNNFSHIVYDHLNLSVLSGNRN